MGWANLTRAKLGGAILTNASLIKADMRYACLGSATMINTDLIDADLSNAFLNFANLTNANLTNAILDNALISDVDLTKTVGLTKEQLMGGVCGNENTKLPFGFSVPTCDTSVLHECLTSP